MKIYDANYLYDDEDYSIGLYSSSDKAIQKLLRVVDSYDLLTVYERYVDTTLEDKIVWECDEGVETFYA
jgi:hypothetical protein